MSSEYINKTIALAGIHQALQQVQEVAWNDRCDTQLIDTNLLSLFQRDPESYIDVYGSREQISSGLEALKNSFVSKHDKLALERARYMVSLMMLSKNIQR